MEPLCSHTQTAVGTEEFTFTLTALAWHLTGAEYQSAASLP